VVRCGAEFGLKSSKPDKKDCINFRSRVKQTGDQGASVGLANVSLCFAGLLTRRTHIGEPIMALRYDVRLCRRLPFRDADGHERKIWETR